MSAGPLVAARLAGFVLTFAIPLVLARHLPLELYGTYKQLFLVSQVLFAVLPLGVAQSLYYFLPRAEQPRTFLAHTQGILLLTGGLGALSVALLLGVVGATVDNAALGEFALPLAIYTFGLVGAYPLEVSLTSAGRVKTCAAVGLTSDALRATALLAPVLLGWGLGGAMWAIAGWALLRLTVCLLVGVFSAKGAWFDRTLLRTQLTYALPFGAAMVISLPAWFAHDWIVSARLGPALYAIYAVGCFQIPIVDILYSPTCELLMVRLRELEHEGRISEAGPLIAESIARLAYLFVPLAAFLIAAAPEFIVTLFGAKFAGSVPIFRVSVVGILFSCLPVDAVLRARGHTRYLFVGYGVRAALAIPLVLLGISLFGVVGAIVGYVATHAIGNVVLALRMGPSVETRFWDLLPHRALGTSFGAATLAAASVFALRELGSGALQHTDIRLLPLAAAGVLFTLSYLVVLRVAGERPTDVLFAVLRRQSV